jgi:hypothetical protein
MTKFIQCFDEESKNELLNNGFKMVNKFKTNNGFCWIFENNEKIKTLQFNNQKLIFTDRLNF